MTLCTNKSFMVGAYKFQGHEGGGGSGKVREAH